MPEYQTHEHDVLVIGAGGAGLRAAIEASAAGVSVGLVCKSLLGKAHTVMAEGGIAAAMGNVDDRDNWKVHFADTMRGGQYINQSRMAELHAKDLNSPGDGEEEQEEHAADWWPKGLQMHCKVRLAGLNVTVNLKEDGHGSLSIGYAVLLGVLWDSAAMPLFNFGP